MVKARRENFVKTDLARKCIRKLNEDEACRVKYENCKLEEMVEQVMANGEICIEEE